MRSWQPPEVKEGYRFESVTTFLEKAVVPRTVDELINDPYPDNIVQVCYFDTDTAEKYGSSGARYDLIMDDGSVFTPTAPVTYENYVYQCDILRKNGDTLTVVILPSLDNEKTILIKKFPLAGISFRPKPYSSDQHLKNAFRHYIGISDAIFPEQWKEEAGESSTTDECSLYLAPSSIPNAGYGVYTTRAIKPGRSIVVEDSPTIIVTDSIGHNNGTEVVWSVIDYAWSAESNAMLLSFNIG